MINNKKVFGNLTKAVFYELGSKFNLIGLSYFDYNGVNFYGRKKNRHKWFGW